MYRLFTAIDIPEKILNHICSFQKKIPSLKWCGKEQMHLTLNFIGNADEELFSGVKEKLASVTYGKFKISLCGTGFFPGIRNPSIFWLGIEKSAELADLQKKIETALLELDIKSEARDFKPHLTLLRIRNRRDFSPEKLLEIYSGFKTVSFEAKLFTLYSSRLTPNGPIYTGEAGYPIKTDNF